MKHVLGIEYLSGNKTIYIYVYIYIYIYIERERETKIQKRRQNGVFYDTHSSAKMNYFQ